MATTKVANEDIGTAAPKSKRSLTTGNSLRSPSIRGTKGAGFGRNNLLSTIYWDSEHCKME
ncbi:hypothetical protein SOVF_028440 [Spinacia oleracea]|nr:hypothetical protein SOVF_028440 [Spinacia oleracea]